jgi:hypothetical protein
MNGNIVVIHWCLSSAENWKFKTYLFLLFY